MSAGVDDFDHSQHGKSQRDRGDEVVEGAQTSGWARRSVQHAIDERKPAGVAEEIGLHGKVACNQPWSLDLGDGRRRHMK